MFRTGLYVIQADSGKIIYQQIRNVYHAVQCRYGSELYQYETVTFTGQLLGIDPSGSVRCMDDHGHAFFLPVASAGVGGGSED